MAIFRGAGGPGDATTDAANEASVASTKAAEAEASATAAASSAISASNSATTAINSKDAAATSESNAATSALAAATSEDNASTSASAADTSATAAQTAQTAAEAAKTAAETAETGAEVAQTAAESAQTAAELAQTGAETAETNAETAQAAAESALASTLSTLDEFDDIYLGAKASPPNTDNDGNTLQTGAIYWDTGDNQLYIWDGANWDAAAFNVTGAVTSFNTRTGAVTLQNNDVTTAVGQSLQVGDSPTFAGLTATGNIAVTGTVDGRNVATDGTKLDGIEANADVTDATNVTAAGAVMDSELTSEASVKALDQGVSTTNSPSFAGLTTTANINFGDNDRAIFGAGSDLQIYHNGANSYIDDTGTGNLYIRASDTVRLQSATGEQGVIVTTDGAVTLYHDNGAKLSTTATGIDVTGTVVSDGLTVASDSTYAIDVSRVGAGNTTLRITGGSTAGNDAVLRADIANTTGTSAVYFGDSTTNGIGRIMYEHNGDYMRFYTSSTEKVRITSAGNVGIGTSSPANKLEVSGAIVAQGAATAYTNTGLYLQNKGSSVFDVGAWRSGASVAELTFSTDSGSDAAPVERMRITSTGNVGIGITSPAEPLHVIGTIRSNTSSTGDFNFYATSTGGGAYRIYPDDATTANPTWLYQSNSSEDQAWVIGGVERMRIDSSGNVGIGTTSPAVKLHVSSTGTPIFRIQDADGSDYYAQISQATGNTIFDTRFGASNGAFIFRGLGGGTADEYMRITSTGNVGIGTTNPGSLLHLSASDPRIRITDTDTAGTFELRNTSNVAYINNLANAAMIFSTNSIERIRITSAGNVGIGTTNPLTNLVTVGTTMATSQAFVGSVSDTSYSGGIINLSNSSRSIGITADPTNAGTGSLINFSVDGSEYMRITSAGNVGIGTSSPGARLHVANNQGGGVGRILFDANVSSGYETSLNVTDTGFELTSESNSRPIIFNTGSTPAERMRIDGSGNVGIGTTSTLGAKLFVAQGAAASPSTSGNMTTGTVVGSGIGGEALNVGTDADGVWYNAAYGNNAGVARIHRWLTGGLERMRITSTGNVGIGIASPQELLHLQKTGGSTIRFQNPGVRVWNIGNDSTSFVFYDSTAAAERMRIDSSGNFLVGKTSATTSLTGFEARSTGFTAVVVAGEPLHVERKTSDGVLIRFRQDGTTEGHISVNGTTVSLSGGHLARWSQLADNTRDETILKGTVMTNLDQMAEWTTDGVTEDNEQLNCMAVSSVEGDSNVAGVFVNWDNDDDVYTNDMNIAMTGDMIIRIAAGTTVARGNLLMSAGDGTAKPQGDDIVRSKTIAKATSTHVTCTYDDGSYCVPCVLMAC